MAARKLGLGSCDWGRWELEGGVAMQPPCPVGLWMGTSRGRAPCKHLAEAARCTLERCCSGSAGLCRC